MNAPGGIRSRLLLGFAAILLLFGIAMLVVRIRPHFAGQRLAAPAALALSSFDKLPGWAQADLRPALAAFGNTCRVLGGKPPAMPLGGAGYGGAVSDWRRVCAGLPSGSPSATVARRYFESGFQPLEVVSDSQPAGLFTGYYEPELSGSRTPRGAYQTPVFGPPSNLVSADLGLFRPQWSGQKLYGCLTAKRLAPCASRGAIAAHGLPDAPVLFYVNDPVALFFLHIQGSGRVRLDNGGTVRAVYAGQNGRPYRPIGRTLIEHRWLDRAQMSMQSIRAWLKAHPQQARGVMETDPSYVFFDEQPLGDPDKGAVGSEGVPLTAGASLAVDARVHPLGVPVYVATSRPDAKPSRPDHPFSQLLIAQDTGGAIRGPARGDVYWGWGGSAESIAGRMKARGRFFVLVPKAVAARLGRRRTVPLS